MQAGCCHPSAKTYCAHAYLPNLSLVVQADRMLLWGCVSVRHFSVEVSQDQCGRRSGCQSQQYLSVKSVSKKALHFYRTGSHLEYLQNQIQPPVNSCRTIDTCTFSLFQPYPSPPPQVATGWNWAQEPHVQQTRHTGRVSTFACKPFDAACKLCEHSHWPQCVP